MKNVLSAGTIFLGSFLSFGVQPLVGRTLLPVFGGVASVWVTCLAAFQALLFLGYLYAHFLSSGRRRWYWLHLALLLLSSGWMAFVSFRHDGLVAWTERIGSPSLGALLAVMLIVAVPYLLLAANSSLVQFLSGGNYRLYAVSNAGSFLGLIAYPFVFELYLSIGVQWMILAVAGGIYALLLALLVMDRRRDGICEGGDVLETADGHHATNPFHALLWMALPALTCFLLNSATSHLTTNVAPIPLIWVLLLGVFLLSYILGYARTGERLLVFWLPLAYLAAMFAGKAVMLGEDDAVVKFRLNLAAVVSLLFFGCTALHAWLCRIRPGRNELTRYYFYIALGGAIGGVLSSIVVPMVFSNTWEYPVAIAMTSALVLAAPFNCWKSAMARVPYARIGAIGLFLVCAYVTFTSTHHADRNVLARGRSFYGAWRVMEIPYFNRYGKRYDMRVFSHGGTTHGQQAVNPLYRDEPTTYYGKQSAGLAFDLARSVATNRPLRASIVGLGVGSMAIYGRENETIRFYEICPQVVGVARNVQWFDYLDRCKANVEIVVSDARKALEAETVRDDGKWDLLTIDAYSGDSIPMHLITREAFDLYASRLNAGGVLALHITNWNLDLLPIVNAAARHLGWNIEVVVAPPGLFTLESQWAFLSSSRIELPDGTRFLKLDNVREMELPSDAKGSLLPIVNLR